MFNVTGTSARTNLSRSGEFFEIATTSKLRVYVRLDHMDGEVVHLPAKMADSLREMDSGLEGFKILDRVTVTWADGRRTVTGEIHSRVFEREAGRGVMIKRDGSNLSAWMPLPDGVIVTSGD